MQVQMKFDESAEPRIFRLLYQLIERLCHLGNMELPNKVFTKSNINQTLFLIEDLQGIKQYIFKFDDENIKVNINQFSYDAKFVENISFISNFGLTNDDIIKFYAGILFSV